MKFIWAPGVKRGERQNDKIHYLLHRGAEEQAAHKWVLIHKTQPAARSVVNGRCRASDKEVQCDTKNIGADAPMESLPAKQPAGNHARNVPSKQDASLYKVQGPGAPPPPPHLRSSSPSPHWS